ncbi:MAG TPA: hypothetical protein PKV77_09130 [Bacteroidales bacterium]|nr:hypothetical protein [Bacteroidales bacterium]
MKIECLTTFLDGKDRYESGDVRTVEDDKGAQFVANGWAKDVAGRVATGSESSGVVNLAVDNSVIGLGDSNG